MTEVLFPTMRSQSTAHNCSGKCIETQCPCKTFELDQSIWSCSRAGDFEMVKKRISARPNLVEAIDPYGYTALHYAAQHAWDDIVLFLLEMGSLVDGHPGGCGATPLHRSAYAGHTSTCKLLIEAGASLDSLDSSFGDYRTPMHKAASRGHLDTVRYFIEAGANATIRDSNGMSAEDMLGEYLNADRESVRPIQAIACTVNKCKVEIEIATSQRGVTCPMCSSEVYALCRIGDTNIRMCKICKEKKF